MSSGPKCDVDPHDATTPAAATVEARHVLAPGARVGRYEIVRLIGRGGMGQVYAGFDPELERQVALKLLHPESRIAPAVLIGEAKALAQLDDPHVVQVFDAGPWDGGVFIAMQLIAGEDLRSVLAKRHPAPSQILAWFVDAGRGLAAAHAAGLVHRDFKPANVLLDHRGRIAVTDFGLARSVRDGSTPVTGNIAGTPSYMAPEQHTGTLASEASDQFAFCVALWEALFGHHPYLRDAIAIGDQMISAPLRPPPRRTAIPRRVIDALERGLARDPAARWPSMNELLAAIAPARSRPLWPLLAAGAIAVAAVSVAVYTNRAQAGARCEDRVHERVARVWSPTSAAIQTQQFATVPRTYSLAVAARVADALDRYTSRWTELAREVCANADGGGELVARKQLCLDASLDRLRALVGVLAAPTADVVDRVPELLASLPELGDCAEPRALLAGPAAPAPAIEEAARELTRDIDRVTAEQIAGSSHTLEQARALVTRAEALGWGPGIARTHMRLGRALAVVYRPALDELVRGAELGIAHHLDREAASCWMQALAEAAYENKSDAIEMLASAARSTAVRIGDPALSLDVEIAYGRALIQNQRWDEGLAICRPAVAAADKLGRTDVSDHARDCMFEGLLPAGKLDDEHVVATERVATTTQRFGPDAPQLATYLHVLADADAQQGDIARARAEIDRALEVVRKAYPGGRNLKNAETLRVRATVEAAEGRAAESLATLREALAIAKSITPEPIVILADIQTGIALALAAGNDPAAAQRAFEDAIASARAQSSESMPLAMLLLNYGQLVGGSDFEAGQRSLDEARRILDHKHDPRAMYASAALCVIEAQHGRWQDARVHAQEAVDFAARDPNAVPVNTAEIQFVLARALVETHGDVTKARDLARTARSTFLKAGPPGKPAIDAIDRWLATISRAP